VIDWRVLIFAFSVAWIAYVYVGYPAVLAMIALARRVHPESREDYFPTVSVLIAARNEEKDIGWKIRETLAWDYPADRLEVLVASDASTDQTHEILNRMHAPRVRFIVLEVRGGKSRALNQLVNLARGEILFFTDVNSHIDGSCLKRMVRHFADSRVGCVTGNSNSTEKGYRQGASSGTNVYWGNELLIRQFENWFGSVLVCDGAIFCMRRELYRPLLPDVANDFELPLRVGHAGFWILHERTAQVLEKDTASVEEEFSRRRRICAQGALGAWRLRETLRGVRLFQFVSHKCMRWLILAPLVTLLFSSATLVASSFFALALIAQLTFYATAAFAWFLITRGREPGRLLAMPLYISVSSIGAFVGVLDAIKGRRFDVWESPALSRGDASARVGM
jgi:cellulose synthase/poly-beta-1,6-N-acetylglucosamine synthase-like glycosyltransferase